MKYIIYFLLVLIVITQCLYSQQLQQTGEMKQISQFILTLISNYHFLKPTINDEVSMELFDEYFNRLDPNRYFFLQSDIDEFNKYKLFLDDQLKEGNIEFAFKVHQKYLERIHERILYAEYLFKQEMDFEQQESMISDRKNESWAKDKVELNEIWRKNIKNQLLQNKLTEIKAQKKEPTQEENEEKNNENTAIKKIIDNNERILRRYERFYHTMQERDNYDILEDFLSCLTEIFDPHTNYMNWRNYQDFVISLRLSLDGIGAVITTEDGYPKIASIVPGGAADRQGELKAGHYIIEVTQEDGSSEPVVDMPLHKVVRKIRGEKGTKVTLTVLKNLQGIPFKITIERDQIKLEDRAAKSEVREVNLPNQKEPAKIGIVYLPSFYRDFEGNKEDEKTARSSYKDVKALIDNMLQKDKIKGILIDLRYNPGGSLDEAVDLSGLFIKSGAVLQIKTLDRQTVRKDEDGGFMYHLPVVVLVNAFSASASEIMAAIIQDMGRGIVVGQTTYGKGTVQNLIDLTVFLSDIPKAGAIKYTTAKFYRINGGATQQKGVVPDIILPSLYTIEDFGEASQKHVLPYDEIAPVKYKKGNIAKYLPTVLEQHKKRIESSSVFKELKTYIEESKKRKEIKTVSLNLKERMLADEEEEKFSKAIEKFRDDNSSKNLRYANNEESKSNTNDIYLEEAIQILSNLVELSQ